MRRPYRERLRIILNELGAGVGGRAEDVNATIRRASPALRETDKVLKILARQNQVLKDLTTNADTVVGDLAGNRRNVGRFVKEAEDVATTSAERRRDIAAGLQRLPTFLRELKPTLAELGATADASTPYLRDLNASAGQLERFLDNLGPFSESSRVNVRTLAKTADVGRPAIRSRAPDRRRAHEDDREGARARQQPRDRAARPRRPRPRGRDRTSARPAARATRASRRSSPTSSTRRWPSTSSTRTATSSRSTSRASECSEYQNADSLRRKEKESPGFIKRCLAAPRPQPARRHHARPDRHRRRRPGPRAAGAALEEAARRRPSARKRAPEKKSENAPGQPDLKKALERLLRGGGGGNTPSVPAPALPNVPVPSVPRCRRVPAAAERRRPGRLAASPPDPQALLDYLLSP